jgi:hypothetical protein
VQYNQQSCTHIVCWLKAARCGRQQASARCDIMLLHFSFMSRKHAAHALCRKRVITWKAGKTFVEDMHWRNSAATPTPTTLQCCNPALRLGAPDAARRMCVMVLDSDSDVTRTASAVAVTHSHALCTHASNIFHTARACKCCGRSASKQQRDHHTKRNDAAAREGSCAASDALSRSNCDVKPLLRPDAFQLA